MGLLDFFRRGGSETVASAGQAVKDTFDGAGGFARDVRVALTGDVDPNLRAELLQRAGELEAKVAEAQARVNEAEARSTNWFVAGWRPAIGWVGAVALFYKFVARPIVVGFFPDLGFADIDAAALWPIITGMLGLGFGRTVEKANGIQDRH